MTCFFQFWSNENLTLPVLYRNRKQSVWWSGERSRNVSVQYFVYCSEIQALTVHLDAWPWTFFFTISDRHLKCSSVALIPRMFIFPENLTVHFYTTIKPSSQMVAICASRLNGNCTSYLWVVYDYFLEQRQQIDVCNGNRLYSLWGMNWIF